MSAMTDDDLVLEFSPPLIALLLAAERSKGVPLTEEEVLGVRDDATCIRLPRSLAAAMAEQRGYADLDPERCWEQWQAVRTRLSD
ncbi:Addiction module component [Stackebrandtia soli]